MGKPHVVGPHVAIRMKAWKQGVCSVWVSSMELQASGLLWMH